MDILAVRPETHVLVMLLHIPDAALTMGTGSSSGTISTLSLP